MLDLDGDQSALAGISTNRRQDSQPVNKEFAAPDIFLLYFAAIGTAETNVKRRQCLVEAFEAVDILLPLST